MAEILTAAATRRSFSPMGNVSRIIIVYLDAEEQFIIYNNLDGVVLSEETKKFGPDRALVYSAAMGWPDGMKWAIMQGVSADALDVAESGAAMLGVFEAFATALAETGTVLKRTAARDPGDYSLTQNRETFLLGSAAVGWAAAFSLRIITRRPKIETT